MVVKAITAPNFNISMTTTINALGIALVASAIPAHAGTIAVNAITDDASTGISPSVNFTHAISGGSAATVNGVNFEVLTSGSSPANFVWDSGTNSKGQIGANNGDWVPASGGVTGPGIQSLLGGFTFSPNGAAAPAFQTFSLTGLNIGEQYEARLYVRIWDTDGSGRPLDLSFTHGAESDSAGTVPEDRPSLVIGSGNDQQAYYVSYTYTAQADQLDITAAVAAVGGSNSGSAHMYALSNQTVVPEPSSLALAALGMLGLIRRRRA